MLHICRKSVKLYLRGQANDKSIFKDTVTVGRRSNETTCGGESGSIRNRRCGRICVLSAGKEWRGSF